MKALLLLSLVMLPSLATEERVYLVNVQGAGDGKYSQTLTGAADGSIQVVCSSGLQARKFLVSYTYEFTCNEIWKGGALVSATATRNDNGSVLQIKAGPGSCDWTSSFWTLPNRRTGTLKVLDYDSGLFQNCTLQFIGRDKTGRHWKLTGGIETDLWYDANARLVRREMIRKGRPTTITLKA